MTKLITAVVPTTGLAHGLLAAAYEWLGRHEHSPNSELRNEIW
jgi:hypothetical protein